MTLLGVCMVILFQEDFNSFPGDKLSLLVHLAHLFKAGHLKSLLLFLKDPFSSFYNFSLLFLKALTMQRRRGKSISLGGMPARRYLPFSKNSLQHLTRGCLWQFLHKLHDSWILIGCHLVLGPANDLLLFDFLLIFRL